MLIRSGQRTDLRNPVQVLHLHSGAAGAVVRTAAVPVHPGGVQGVPELRRSPDRRQQGQEGGLGILPENRLRSRGSYAQHLLCRLHGRDQAHQILDDREGIKEARKEYSSFKRAANVAGIPSAIVCGNHDILEDDCAFLEEFAAPIGRWDTRPDSDYAFQ